MKRFKIVGVHKSTGEVKTAVICTDSGEWASHLFENEYPDYKITEIIFV